MKLALFTVLLMLPNARAALSPGERFPDVTLPSVRTGEPVSFSSLTGEKLMLHLFASW